MASCRVCLSGDCAESSVAAPESSPEYRFVVRAIAPGEFSLTGIEYQSVENVRLFSPLPLPFRFVCEADAPTLALHCLCDKHELLAGDATVLHLVAHAGALDIASMSMIVDGAEHVVTLLSPPASHIGGQYFFGHVAAGARVRISLLLSSPVPGIFSNWLFLGYGTKDKLPRYQHFHSRLRVLPCENALPSFPSFSPWPMPLQVSMKHLTDSQFQLTMRNPTKRTVRAITVEFNAVDSSAFVVSGLTRRTLPALPPRSAVAFCFHFLSLDRESYPVITLSVAGSSYRSDTSIFLSHYDRLQTL
jgi:hypothetical protein